MFSLALVFQCPRLPTTFTGMSSLVVTSSILILSTSLCRLHQRRKFASTRRLREFTRGQRNSLSTLPALAGPCTTLTAIWPDAYVSPATMMLSTKHAARIATYARGTANGGGLYPLEFYWVSGPSTPQVPGIYHWNTNSGALQRLLAGDVTPDVRAALSGTADTDQFLLVTVKYWKNAFKYNSFTHHVVTSDLGSATEVLRWSGLVAPSEGRPVHMWFDSEILDGMLGLDPVEETVLAVIPLPQGELERNDRCDPGGARVHISESERFTAAPTLHSR